MIVINRLDGVHHLVEGQHETEMIRLVFVVGQVVDGAPLGLCRNGYKAEYERDGKYFQCFFQNNRVLMWIKRCLLGFIARKCAAKIGNFGIWFKLLWRYKVRRYQNSVSSLRIG